MWMTPLDVAGFLTQLVTHVADRMEIPDFELKSATELMAEIGEKDVKVADALLDFSLAYEEWYAVHRRMEQAGRSEKRQQILAERIRNRDAARATLKKALEKYS